MTARRAARRGRCYGFGGGIHDYPGSRGGGYGAELKDEYRRYYGSFVSFAGRVRRYHRQPSNSLNEPTVSDHWANPFIPYPTR